MTRPKSELFLRGPSDLNDLAVLLLDKRPVPEGRRLHLAGQVICRMLAVEQELGAAPERPIPLLGIARADYRVWRAQLLEHLDKPLGEAGR